ncbi:MULTISPECIES: DUF4272 domain-containing protein [Butyricimonas]|uniref:DUF4272 domain-containing protein n=1 Tax=Butyricimonas TaxID=574697 RepID=UPI0007FB3EAD|nr:MULTISPECIES: DUF4272 domain-containing protein [Butyricimonas]
MEKANLTLYTVIGDFDRVAQSMEKRFSEVAKMFTPGDDRWMLVLQDDSVIRCSMMQAKNEPEQVAEHTNGMANYFARVETELSEIKEEVVRQITCFNCIVGIEFETDDNRDRTNYIVNTIFDVAADINGFVLYPSMSLYDGKGKLLFSVQGESEYEAFRPVANSDLLEVGRPEPGEVDLFRRERSLARLREAGVPYIEHLPCEVLDSEAVIRDPEEIACRAAALFAVALYSEVMLSENPDREEGLGFVQRVDAGFHIMDALTPAERAYLDNPSPERHDCIQFLWRYECCAVLLWALGITELPYPSEICDVPFIARLFFDNQENGTVLGLGEIRGKKEILDEADLTLRYDWACVDARIKGQEAPVSLDGGVVMERHYAFNWLIGASEGADWDDIQPTT